MTQGTHHATDDPRNRDIRIYVNGDLRPRAQAVVSVFDSGFILGDGVWEGLRVHRGRIAFLGAHLDRLYEAAKAIDLDVGMDRAALTAALYRTLAANAMTEGVHMRLMVTRGLKSTPYQDPRASIGPATVVIIPEYKLPRPELLRQGVRLFTVHVRRGAPDVQDPKLNSQSKLNCITACIQATKAGADEALMLDPHGFVATCNSTHFFIVRRGEVWTSSGNYCIAGITRANVLRLCCENGIPAFEKNFSLTETYSAQEAFITGTYAGIAPVIEIDGRRISDGR
ncbi:MAG TPA: aminotransferase class IV, partial [Steroidobacteraceae bacterium]|nr:aminotransferase class IV [Steroidobacteraceae bacterium]